MRHSIARPEHALCMQSECIDCTCGLAMASLQIRDVPDPLHRLLQRRLALERSTERWQQRQALPWEESPESLIRSDRERGA